jgi:hypothetical protein
MGKRRFAKLIEFNGTFQDVRRVLASADDREHRVCYMSVQGCVSFADLVAHLGTVAPGKPLSEVGVNLTAVCWVDDATEEEMQAQVERERHDRESRERWERETYERLKAKFG